MLPSALAISARGYKIGGIAHGLGNPAVIASGVAPSGSAGQSASSGSNILVLSSVNHAVTAYRIGNDGTVSATVGLAGFVPPLLAFDGSNYVAASYAQNPADGGNADLTFQRLSPSGTLLDPSPGLFISSFANIQSATPIGIGGGTTDRSSCSRRMSRRPSTRSSTCSACSSTATALPRAHKASRFRPLATPHRPS